MKDVILDSSSLLQVFDDQPEENDGHILFDLIQKGKISVTAPTFLLVEIVNILLKKKNIPVSEIRSFIEKIQGSNIRFVDFTASKIDELLNIASKEHITAYDALYVLLARDLKQPVLTEDRELLAISDLGMNLHTYLTS